MARNIGLVAAFEEEQALAEVEAVQVDGVIEDGDNLETHVGDLVEAEGSADAELQNIDDGVQASDELEAHQDIMEGSLENGGMDETAAQVVEVAIESIRNRLGMSRKMTMPALESFGAKGNRVQATRLAMEELPKFLKTIWDAIVKAYENVTNWIKSFWIKLTDSTQALKQRVQKLSQAVVNVKNKESETETIKAGSFGQHIVTSKGSDIKTIQEAYSALEVYTRNSKKNIEFCKTFMGVLESAESLVTNQEEFDSIKFDVVGLDFNLLKTGEFVSEEMPGNVTFRISSKPGFVSKLTNGGDIFDFAKHLKYEAAAFGKKAPVVTELKCLTTGDMNVLLDETFKIIKNIEDSKPVAEIVIGARNKLNTVMKKIRDSATAAKDVVKDSATKIGGGSKAREIQVREAFVAINKFSSACTTVCQARGVTTGKRMMDYVGASLATFDKVAKTEAE